MILEAMVNKPEGEEPEGEVVDLFNHPNFKGDLDTFQRVRTQDISASREDEEEEMDREFKKFIQSLPDDYEDPEDEEDYMTEQKGDSAYPGQLGVATPAGETDSSSQTKQDLQDELESTVAQINAIGSNSDKQQQKKVLQRQRGMIQTKLDTMST